MLLSLGSSPTTSHGPRRRTELCMYERASLQQPHHMAGWRAADHLRAALQVLDTEASASIYRHRTRGQRFKPRRLLLVDGSLLATSAYYFPPPTLARAMSKEPSTSRTGASEVDPIAEQTLITKTGPSASSGSGRVQVSSGTKAMSYCKDSDVITIIIYKVVFVLTFLPSERRYEPQKAVQVC